MRRLQSSHLSGSKAQEDDFEDGEEEQSQDQDGFHSTFEEALTLEEELLEGERQQQELVGQYPLWHNPQALEQLKGHLEDLRTLDLRPDLLYVFAALDTPRPLAASCPNGMVFFSRGLLEHLSPDQVLFFAAHEIAHTELRHFATRYRRLADLRRGLPGAPGTAVRMRLEQASVLAVRHQEEFEADHQAATWLDFLLGSSSLSGLWELCRRLSPESLQNPSHPTFSARLGRMDQQLAPPDPLDYAYSLMV